MAINESMLKLCYVGFASDTLPIQNAPQNDNKTGVTYLTNEENVFPRPPFQRRLHLTPARSKVTDCLFLIDQCRLLEFILQNHQLRHHFLSWWTWQLDALSENGPHAHQLVGIWTIAECIAMLFVHQLMHMDGPIETKMAAG
jgi:hypothetical protein